MTLEVEVEHKMRRQVLMYFSIVRRNACWASFVSLSTSVSNTTKKKREKCVSLIIIQGHPCSPHKDLWLAVCARRVNILYLWTPSECLTGSAGTEPQFWWAPESPHGPDFQHRCEDNEIKVKSSAKKTLCVCNCMHVLASPWVDFQVVVAGYSVNFDFLFWGGLESESSEKRNNITLKS